MPGPRYAFFKGQIVPIEQAKVSVMTHALHYGTAAFAGMRAYWNDDEHQLFVFRPIDHFTRFKQSASLLMIDLPYTPEQLRDILVELLRREDYHENIYIRPLVYKSEEGIGVRLHKLSGDFTMFALPFGNYLEHEEGLSVCFSTWRRVDDNAIPARGKVAGSYVNSALAKSEASLNGFDEALVLNQDGHIAEASAANFFMIRKGKVVTPPIHANILEGIVRGSLITLFNEVLHMEVVERDIDRTEIYSAEEAFLCGTGVQLAAITSVDHRPIGSGKLGPVVGELRRLFFDMVQGKLPQYRHWVQPIYSAEPVKTR